MANFTEIKWLAHTLALRKKTQAEGNASNILSPGGCNISLCLTKNWLRKLALPSRCWISISNWQNLCVRNWINTKFSVQIIEHYSTMLSSTSTKFQFPSPSCKVTNYFLKRTCLECRIISKRRISLLSFTGTEHLQYDWY